MMGNWFNGCGFFGHPFLGGWPMMLGGFLLTVLAVVLLVVLIRRAFGHGYGHRGHEGHEGHGGHADDAALRILNERYAKGEIGDEEYARKKETLRK